MKPRLLDHVVCPIDRGALRLVEWETRPIALSANEEARAHRNRIPTAKLERDVVTGLLINDRLRIFYPVVRSVPRLIPFDSAVTLEFAETHRARLDRELPGFTLPHAEPMPGDRDVLRTFSREWLEYDWDGRSYWNLSPDRWFESMRFVLKLDERPIRDQLVLEVGIGIGGVADHHAREEGAEVVGIDLGYAVDPAQIHFGENPFLHIVQASAFAPPFRDQTFDFVYSFGVIHHTFSTKTAFDRLALLPKPNGRLYVWVYSDEAERRNVLRRVLMVTERAVRPWMSQLPDRWQTVALAPFVPLYMVNQARRAIGKGQVFYGLREAIHAARDRFTPRYIHRHSNDEVCAWFREAGYGELECTGHRERPSSVPVPFVSNTGVYGVRAS